MPIDLSALGKFFDPYSLKARLFPFFWTVSPVLWAAGLLVPWSRVSVSSAWIGVVVAAVLYGLADLSRQCGRKVEKKIYVEMGGKPSTLMLQRGSNATFPENVKDKYRNFLAGCVQIQMPSEAEERANPELADGFYEGCGNWLRENTRDRKAFPLLNAELATYGYRRNLYGTKWIAIGFSFCILAIMIGWIIYRNVFDIEDDFFFKSLLVLGFCVFHLSYMVFGVTKEGVKEAANIYARELILSCEKLMGQAAKPASPRKLREKKADKA